jgi:subtilisin family serine protease/subtilase family serine protease
MRRIPVGVAVLFGAIAMLLSSAPTSTQERRRPRGGVDLINGREAVAREVLVKFRRTLRPQELTALGAQADAEEFEAVGRTGVRRIRSRSVDLQSLISLLANHPDVAYAEPNFIVHAFAQPDDTYFPLLWGLLNNGQAVNGGGAGTAGADIHAVQAWDLSVGSTDNVVGVVDTGVDYTHPDLAANMWSAPTDFTVTIGGVPITCPAGTHGFNAIALTCDPMDDHNHGTHVSGTIGALGNNTLGVVGVNWTTEIMGIKFLDSSGSGSVADAVNGIEFAIQAKQAFAGTGGANVRVLSNSWGGNQFSQALLDEINAANSSDMLFVAAAGNSGLPNDMFPTYPANYTAPNIIAVAATTNTDSLAYFSNYGAASVHLGAPGVDIASTIIGGTYAYFSGTSMATPHVSGAAALVLSLCSLDTTSLKGTLLNAVEPVPGLAGFTITGGRLDVNNAVRACSAPPTTPTGLTAAGGDSRVTLTWSVAPGAATYNVKRSLTAGGPYSLLASGITAKAYVDTAVVNRTTYYYVVSASNPQGESSDSNEASATPKQLANLIIATMTAPSAGGSGAPLVVSDTTQNLGPGLADPSTTRFYLSTNAQLDAADTLLNGAHSVPELASGASQSASTTVQLPANLTTGTYYLIGKADADGVVAETLETNNTFVRLVQVGPDLVATSLTGPSSAAAGSSITLTDTVKNQGGGAAGGSTTRFYLSTNAALDASDILLTSGRAVPELAAGATSTGSVAVTIPASVTAGTYYLFAKADGDSAVGETQEANNVTLRSIQIGGDLVVTALTVPAKGAAGSAVLISDTTADQGAGGVSASTTRFYLSVNVLWDATDTLLSASRSVPDLAAGTSSSGSTTVLLPDSLPPGTYYLIAKADADNVVVETQEVNNTLARGIQIGGDLTVSALTTPTKGGPGSTILVSDTTTNQGAGNVGPSTTRFFLSSNFQFDAGDKPLGERGIGSLASGASSAGSTELMIPNDIAPGLYWLLARADAGDVVAESQETNNVTARSITIGPDLIVALMTVPSTVAAGSTITVGDTIRNQGGAAAGESTTRFYLSINTSLDAGDVLLAGARAVPALQVNGQSTGSIQVTIPAGTVPGTYIFMARADDDLVVPEGQETNNVGLRWIQVTAGP